MVRKPVVIFTSIVLLAAANAKALGLGDITLESALNQPLRANIPLLQLGDVRADQISVQLASESDFARFSIDREAFLGNIQFDVQPAGAQAVVQLSTLDAVREPYLSFVLETRWPTGRLLSEYTVLLDLPAFAGNAPAPAVLQPVQQVSQTPSSPQQTIENQSLAPSSSGDFSEPVRLAAPQEPAQIPAADTIEPAPNLIAQVDQVDADADAAAAADALATPAPEVPAPAPAVPEPAATSTPLAAPAAQDSITTDANDTLWDIALQVRPDSSVSVQQTMLAIQRLNTDAFIGGNINMVRRGQVLRIPDIEQIRALSSREAIGEVARQNQLFENRRNVPLSTQPLSTPPTAPADASGAPRGELSVVSVDSAEPGAQTASGQSAELDARIASLEDVLAVQREEADRAVLQNAELTERLGLLEEQIASAQEIIRLRDLELAQLQESLASAPVVAETAEAPTVITMAPDRTFMQILLDTLMANTIALLGVTALVISLLVFMLLKRNRAAEQAAALAGMDGIAGEPRISEPEVMPLVAEDTLTSQESAKNAPAAEDFDEIFDLAASAEDDLRDVDAVGLETQTPAAPADDGADALMAEVDALIAESRYPEATSLLQDSIVVQPERTDLRLKLLEVFAVSQDAVGFKLQETELRDMAGESVAPRIAELRAQLRDSVQDDILDEGDDVLFADDAELDDLELSLDMEASAEVDDAKVLKGFTLEDDVPGEALEVQEQDVAPSDTNDADEFALDDIDFDFADQETEEPVAAAPDKAADTLSLSSDFDLSADDEVASVEFDTGSAVEFAPELTAAAPAAAANDDEDNLLDFDFDLSVDEEEPEFVAPGASVSSPEQAEEPDGNEVDFDFSVLEDEPEPVAAPVADAETDDEEDFDFDAEIFDLAVEDEVQPAAQTHETAAAPADDFEDLQFVDETLLDSLEKPATQFSENDDDDFEYLSDADEAATKLDLARAYYEMGDSAGAREILEEVLREGNDDQVMDARDLLSKL